MIYRFALIGCGKIGPRHAEQMARVGKIAGVCDISRERADTLAKTYNTNPYYSIKELLDSETGIDIVSICTPNGLHALHTKECLNHGKHVLCEKPLTISVKDAEELVGLARVNNRKLFVVKSTRYNPNICALKNILDAGGLGDLFSFQLDCFWNRPNSYYRDTWRGSMGMDGGTLFTQFSHYIDILCWFFGELKNVTGVRRNFFHNQVIEFEDSGVASLEMKNGMIGGLNWSVNAYQKNMEISLTVIAEKGTVKLSGEYLNTIAYQMIEGTSLEQLEGSAPANDYGSYKGSMSNHDKVYTDLVRAFDDENSPVPDASEGLKTVAFIENIYSKTVLL